MKSTRNVSLIWLIGLAIGCGPGFTGTSQRFELSSTRVGDTFVITTWLPKNYESSSGLLPALFQLDGEAQAAWVAKCAEDLGLEIIVVGIAAGNSGKRLRDYTPTEDSRFGPDTGRGAAFSAFVTEELIPRIEADHRASPANRTLMGHSLGGLAVVDQLLSQRGKSSTFTNFAAASPSLWWDSGVILQRERSGGELTANVFLSTAAVESSDIILYTNAIIARFEGPSYRSLRLKHQMYANTGHALSYEKAYPDALRFFYGK